MTIPSPCGLAITSVTSDNQYLYALAPDRKTVYKLDTCGRIICVFKLTQKYNRIHYCGGRFYATVSGETTRIYVLNGCFTETEYISPDFPCEPTCTDNCSNRGCRCPGIRELFIGPSGNCNEGTCMLVIATPQNSYVANSNGKILSSLSYAGRNKNYTAVAENNGILFEGLESTTSNSSYIRATLLATGQTKLQRLPCGYKVKGFFCYDRRLYAFITKNAFHAYVAAICVFVSSGVLCGEILSLPEDADCENCFDESCGCRCESTSCGCVSSNQSDFCDSAVSGDSTDGGACDCDVDELCRLFNCIKKLCKNRPSSCACGSCVNGCGCGYGNSQGCGCACGDNTANGGCCNGGTLSCTSFPQCNCNDSDADSDNCLPMPVCPDNACFPGCARPQSTVCSCDDLKVSFSATK